MDILHKMGFDPGTSDSPAKHATLVLDPPMCKSEIFKSLYSCSHALLTLLKYS